MATRQLCMVASLMALWAASPARGQDVPVGNPASLNAADSLPEATADSLVVERVSPGGAFLRSILVPGWGQAAVRSYNRAGFYFTVETVSLWMFLKSRRTLVSAEKELAVIEADVTARLIADGVDDPQAIESALEDDEVVSDLRSVVASRGQQREDWVAFGLFMVLIGGADAFVAAHLQDFPDALQTTFSVLPDGRVEAGLSLRLPPH